MTDSCLEFLIDGGDTLGDGETPDGVSGDLIGERRELWEQESGLALETWVEYSAG